MKTIKIKLSGDRDGKIHITPEGRITVITDNEVIFEGLYKNGLNKDDLAYIYKIIDGSAS